MNLLVRVTRPRQQKLQQFRGGGYEVLIAADIRLLLIFRKNP